MNITREAVKSYGDKERGSAFDLQSGSFPGSATDRRWWLHFFGWVRPGGPKSHGCGQAGLTPAADPQPPSERQENQGEGGGWIHFSRGRHRVS